MSSDDATPDGAASALRIAFFGHDACESTVIKRTEAFAAAGADVFGVMFRRARAGTQRTVACDVVDLGVTVDRNYARRVGRLAAATGKLVAARARLKTADVFYARNIDMLALAVAAKAITRTQPVIVYEVLDVQRAFLGSGAAGRAFRSAEKRLLRHVDLLVVSSPDFVRQYFGPTQNFSGETFLLENKICPHQLADLAVLTPKPKPSGPPWRIGWFGVLRCQRSLHILSDIAQRLPSRVEIDIRGLPSHEDLNAEDIAGVCDKHPNMTFHGAYAAPRDLADIYGAVHFAWSFDYLDAGSNSDWLLPNRVYEGSAFGAYCLSRDDTMTGRYVGEHNIGTVIAEPVADTVVQLLEGLDQSKYTAMTAALLTRDASAYLDLTDTADLIVRLQRLAQTTRSTHASVPGKDIS